MDNYSVVNSTLSSDNQNIKQINYKSCVEHSAQANLQSVFPSPQDKAQVELAACQQQNKMVTLQIQSLNERNIELQKQENKHDETKWQRILASENALQAELNKLKEEKEGLRLEIHSLTERLAAEMSCKISADERCFENISIAARLKIVEDYNAFVSTTWFNAKTALDVVLKDHQHICTEEWKVRHLLQILYVGYVKGKLLYDKLQQEVISLLCSTSHLSGQKQQANHQITQSLTTGINDFLKNRVEEQNLDSTISDVIETIEHQRSTENDIIARCLAIDVMKQYVAEASRLAWKMVLQRPPMELIAEHIGKPWTDQLSLELMWGSEPNAEVALIRYYKIPALFHDGKCLVRGSVFVA